VVEGLSGLRDLGPMAPRSLYKLEKKYIVRPMPKLPARGPGGGGRLTGPKTLDLSRLRVRVDPRQEWREDVRQLRGGSRRDFFLQHGR